MWQKKGSLFFTTNSFFWLANKGSNLHIHQKRCRDLKERYSFFKSKMQIKIFYKNIFVKPQRDSKKMQPQKSTRCLCFSKKVWYFSLKKKTKLGWFLKINPVPLVNFVNKVNLSWLMVFFLNSKTSFSIRKKTQKRFLFLRHVFISFLV